MATGLMCAVDAALKGVGGPGVAVDSNDVTVIARDSADLGAAALFAAALDPRIRCVDADLQDSCFAKTETFGGWWLAPGYDPSVRPAGLSILPFVLRHGDVLQWAALLADRRVALRNVPAEAGDPAWLSGVFAAAGHPDGVVVEKSVTTTGERLHVEPADGGGVRLSFTP